MQIGWFFVPRLQDKHLCSNKIEWELFVLKTGKQDIHTIFSSLYLLIQQSPRFFALRTGLISDNKILSDIKPVFKVSWINTTK